MRLIRRFVLSTRLNFLDVRQPPFAPPRRFAHSLVDQQFEIPDEKIDAFLSDLQRAQQPPSGDCPTSSLSTEQFSLSLKKAALDQALQNEADLRSLLDQPSTDPELRALAEIDLAQMRQNRAKLKMEILENFLTPEFSIENQAGCVLSATAGVGGQEAMLFTKELIVLYQNYARFKGWTLEILELGGSDIGGCPYASASILGPDAFKCLRFESGVHRVQRVPVTERSGRLHTSTATVTVGPLPSVVDELIDIPMKDLRKETFKARGHGGQNLQKTESAVRITHLPTKTVVECQQERSQMRNFDTALQRLKSKLYTAKFERENAKLERMRKLQMGSGDRCEKIRTYNFTDNRVSDHRIKKNFFGMDDFMTGGQSFDQLVVSLLEFNKIERMMELLNSRSQ